MRILLAGVILVPALASCIQEGGDTDSCYAGRSVSSNSGYGDMVPFANNIFEGTYTTSAGVTHALQALVTTEGQVAMLDLDNFTVFVGEQDLRASFTSYIGTFYTDPAECASFTRTGSAGGAVQGQYSATSGIGSFELAPNDALYTRGAALGSLTGTWVDNTLTDTYGVSTWTFQGDGSFSLSSTSGCSGTGSVTVIDDTRNAYAVGMQMSGCSSLDGKYSGLFFLSDTYSTDDTINLIFGTGNTYSALSPVRQ